MRLARLAVLAVLVAACGSSSHVAVRSTAPGSTTAKPTTTSATVPDLGPHPHFDSPDAAMRYLAAAWNAHDITAERHVTDPDARVQLDDMRSEATDLRFDRCERRVDDACTDMGDYLCWFTHDYPASTPTTMPGGVGQASLLVGPVDTPWWYMTVFKSCG